MYLVIYLVCMYMYPYVCLYVCVCIHPHLPKKMWHKVNFKRSLTGLNSEFL